LLLGIVALLILIVPLLAACGGSPAVPAANPSPVATTAAGQPAQPTAADQPTSAPDGPTGGSAEVKDVTVTLPFQQGGITSFDHAYWTSQLFVSQGVIFEGLYGYDENLNVVPRVAESASASADNTVWTIKLRQDKKWSNGEPVTAKDFYASWVRFISPELKDAPMWVGMMALVKNGWAFKNGAVKADELGIKLVDDYTLEVTLTQPNAAFINFLPVTNAMPINAKSLQEHPNDWWDPAVAVYNGPYVVKSWTSGGDTVLARNPGYVGEGVGNVGTIVLRPYSDANARLQAFENGEVQFTFIEDASQLQYAQNNPQMSNLQQLENPLVWRGLEYNRALDAGPLSDQRVRQALAMAIDKKAITDQILKGLAVPTDTFNSDPRVKDKVKGLPFDVAKAKALLAEAGYPDGKGFPELNFLAPPANDGQMPMIEAVAKMWQDNLGVKSSIQNNETPVYSTLQWASFNKDIKPGFATLGGPMNWFQPEDLTLATNHIWYYMDFKPGGMAKFAEFQEQIDAVPSLEKAGDWAALESRALAVWAKRQEIAAVEDKELAAIKAVTPVGPTFKDQWDALDARFAAAADDAEKLSTYKDALTMVLREEQDVTAYENRTDANRQAQRLLIKTRGETLDAAWETLPALQQLAIDSAWMIPIYYDKLYYVTDPHLSGIVLNKLAWGGIFQYQYMRWAE
jgi:peptide/nickel transport system substrate-binding protein